VLEGTAEVAAGPTPPAFAWAYNEELEPYPYDPDRARRCWPRPVWPRTPR
jgi:peptide/nickel transport system substrate-binding protein